MTAEGTFPKADGDVLYGSEVNGFHNATNNLIEQQLQQNINILINSAAATSTLNPYDDMFLDVFATADGVDATVDETNTTGVFVDEEIINGSVAGESLAETTGGTSTWAIRKTVNISTELIPLSKIEYHSASGSFAMNIYMKYFYSDVTDEVTPTQSTTNTSYSGLKTFTNPQPTKLVTKVEVWTNSNYSIHDTYTRNLYIYGLTPANAIIQTNAETITANPVAHQVYCHNTLAGTGTITYDISFDDGSTWVTDQELSTYNSSVHAGTEMILKINLNGIGTGNTSAASDYSIMLFY